MCGICAVISQVEGGGHPETVPNLLIRRGPDGSGESHFQVNSVDVTLFASVLCCRRTHCSQPAVDVQTGNILAWNGEIFGGIDIGHGNDTSVLSDLLAKAKTIGDVSEVFQMIRGPHSFIYWHKELETLFFGRDVLGRRSLLVSTDKKLGCFFISSVLPGRDGEELLPTGIFCLKLAKSLEESTLTVIPYKWPADCSESREIPKVMKQSFRQTTAVESLDNCLFGEVVMPADVSFDECLRRIASRIPADQIDVNSLNEIYEQSIVTFPQLNLLLDDFIQVLKKSVIVRCLASPLACLSCTATQDSCQHCRVGILFSGGLDSTILAALVDGCLCESQVRVDLLNVAFYKDDQSEATCTSPDRQTAEAVVEALDRRGFERRHIELTCINISQSQLSNARRERIRELILPCETILDDSLGCALWFATSGSCSAKVLFHGLGADELFGGYSRHRASFQSGGWSALEACLLSDLAKLPHRNLGRDDRVAADNSRELRHPFLDENVVHFVNSRIPPYFRLNPYLPRAIGDKLFLRFVAMKLSHDEPLRAWQQCLLQAACYPKRAIQFGSRIANVERSNVKTSNRKINASSTSKNLVEDS